MDLNIDKINAFTESINSSIKTFLVEENKVNITIQGVRDFIVYIQKQYSNILKYKSIESDIIKYLETYDFKQGKNFDDIKNCCNVLPRIEENILQLGQMAKSVKKRPDRYGLVSTVNSCLEFTKYCADTMKVCEVDKAISKSSTLLKRLQLIIDAFQKEDNLLKEIKLLLKENKPLLSNYPAYENELNIFLKSYPHENNVDMQYIKQHLQDLSTIDKKFVELRKEVEFIKKYVDRYGKKNIESKASIILEQGTKNLVYSDLYRVNEFLDKVLKRIAELKNEFQKEEKGLLTLYNELQANVVDIWQEDSDALCMYIKQILDKRTCYVDFSTDDIMRKRDSAIQKKGSDIQSVIAKYNWLKRKRYQQQILTLRRIGISYNKFIQGIDDIKSNRSFFTKIYELIFY